MTAPSDDAAALRRQLRGMRWLAGWALVFGLGIGFYAGFTIGVETAKEAALVAPAAESPP